jgi:hypothetical protein
MTVHEGTEEQERHLQEILQEIRVALPGIQILFAFLLNIAFTDVFHKLSGWDKRVYLIALLLAAIASILLIAPTAFHRLQHGHTHLDVLISDASRLSLAGTLVMGGALISATYFVARVGYASWVATTVAVGVGGLTVLLWLVLPLYRRATASRGSEP